MADHLPRIQAPFAAREIVVGFDLDQTLLDTRPAVAAALERTAAELDLRLDVAAVVSRLGPPLAELLAEHLPQDAAWRCAECYRFVYPEHGIAHARLLPGARQAVVAVRRSGGRALVVTGQNEQTARRHLEREDLGIGVVVGGVWGAGKAEVLREHAADAYVGDHPADIEAARAAGALGVAVTTGSHRPVDLADADAVLSTLEAFPGWLAQAIEVARCDGG